MTISETEVKQEVERQMRIILKGALKLIGEEELREKLARSVRTGKPLNVKLGLDPSAPDIHLGHAVVLRKLKQMQDLGIRSSLSLAILQERSEIPQVRRREEKLSRTEKFCSMHRPIRSKSSEYSTGKKHRFVTMENGWNF